MKTRINSPRFGIGFFLLVFLLASYQAQAIQLNFTPVSGAALRFTGSGDTFEFVNATTGADVGRGFRINLSDGTGDSVNLRGNFGGVFAIGPITVTDPMQTAPVTGTGTFSIFDGATSLTATVSWLQIFTTGNVGGINGGASLNLTNIVYTGSNQDLRALAGAASQSGTLSVSFQFIPAKSLQTLTTDGQINSTTYSGVVRVASGSIGNFVWRDLNRDGIQDPGEPGIDGVTVILNDSGGTPIATAVTAANGFYQFTGLAKGDYTVTVDPASPPLGGMLASPVAAAGSTPQTDSNPSPAPVNLATDASIREDVDFGFYLRTGGSNVPGGQIGDRVWLDRNQNGIQDGDEPGIEGVRIELKDRDGNVIASQDTGEDGSYLFTALFAGDYTVCVDASSPPLSGLTPAPEIVGADREIDSNGSPAGVNLPANDSVDRSVDFGYIPVPSGSIGDFVWRDLDGDGIQSGFTDEPGIPDVTVQLLSPDDVVLQTTTTDVDGYYLFTGLGAGTYKVVVPGSLVLEGYVYIPTTPNAVGSTPDDDSDASPRTVILPLNTSTDTSVDFGYTAVPAGRIGDLVWKDLNGNGIQDEGEPGIEGVVVRLYDTANLVATTTTAGDGTYGFEGLRAGTYFVEVDISSAALAGLIPTAVNAPSSNPDNDSNPNPYEVTLLANTSTDDTVDFGYIEPTGRIGDRVWHDLDENGIQDDGEPGINGVTVSLYDHDNLLIASTVTTGDGGYLFSGLRAGTYKVVVDAASPALAALDPATPNAPGSTASNDSNFSPATVLLADHSSEDLTIDFGYVHRPAGSIGDFVWEDLDGDGIQGATESGIPGVTVFLLRPDDTLLATAVTDLDGFYQFSGLGAGTYKVVVDHASPPLAGFTVSPSGAGGDPAKDSNASPAVVILPLNTSSDPSVDFGYVPPPSGSIGDFVWKDLNNNGIQDSGEPGINGVTVELFGPGNGLLASTVTSGNGSYLFNGLSAGTYTVVVVAASPPLAGLVPTTANASGSTASNDSNAIPATVTLLTNTSTDLNVDFGYRTPPAGGPLTTFTMGGWGSKPSGNNPGTFLAKNFGIVYPNGLIVGGGRTLRFTSAKAIENFLPCGGTAAALKQSYVNPTTKLGVLAGQVVALRLGVDFSSAGITVGGLVDARFKSGKFSGKTVGHVLALAEAVLGGAPLPVGISYSDLSDACTLVNENYDEGINRGNLIP